MASFTDRSPATFTPYIPQKPVDAMVAVGLDREQKYAIGVQRVQEQINTVSALSNSLLRPQAKEYLSSKLNSVVNDINAAAGQDFSQANVYTSLMSKANEVGQDLRLNTELQNSLKVSNKIRAIEDLKEKDPKLYSQFNEEYAMEDVNKWLTSGSPVGSTFNDTKPFSPYYDYNEEIRSSIKDFLANQDVQQTIDPNTGLVTQIKGKTPAQMREYLQSVLSEKAKNQMMIEGHVMGNRLSDQSILELYNSGIDDQIRDEKVRNDDLQKKYHTSSSKMTENEKLSVENDIKNSNQSIAQLQAAKTDSNRIAQVLANKGDFYGQLYTQGTISRLAYANAPTSVTYESNSAIVSQLDHQFSYKMELFRQQQQNARSAAEQELGWARLNQDAYYKDIELGIRQQLANAKTNPGRAAGGVLGSSYLGASPNETVIPTVKTPTLTREESGSQGYERFTGQTDELYRNYGSDKFNLMKNLIQDPVVRREIAGAMGVTSDQALSAYVAAPIPNDLDVYNKFMFMNPDVLNSMNKYLEAKNEQWMKGEKVSKQLDDFFTATSKTKANIDARESYDKTEREALKSNLAAINVAPVRVNGQLITVDDMIDQALTGNNYKINQTKAERSVVTTTSVGGGPLGGMPTTSTIKGIAIDPVLAANVDIIKSSNAFKEYKNQFNETFGQEGMISSFNFDLKNTKDKASRQEFDSYAAQISTLWNDDRRGRQVSPQEIDPSFLVNRATGEVTFSYSYKDSKNKTITSSNNKIVVPSLKSSLIDSDKDFSQMLFYGRGATPLMNVKGPKPLQVSLVSSSNDAKSQYTVNSDGSAARYFLRDNTGQIIDDTMGGFASPTEAMNWIEDINQRTIDNSVANWYRNLATNPQTRDQFNSLSDLEQSKLADQFIDNIDSRHNIQTLSNNRTLNMMRDLRANIAQQAQNRR